MDLTLVVVTHQSEAALGGLLDRLGPELTRRVQAVDNASRDGTLERLAAHRVATLALSRNLGFARAANLAARAATTRWLGFLNPDAAVSAELCEAGLRAVADRPELCAVPRLREPGRVLEGRQPGYTRAKLLADVLEASCGAAGLARALRRLPGHHDHRWYWPHGACFFVARPTFASLGGFDERFFLYMEDVDFGRRLAAAGGGVVAIDETLEHRGAGSTSVAESVRRGLLEAARVRYAEIHYGAAFARTLGLATAAARALRRRLGRPT